MRHVLALVSVFLFMACSVEKSMSTAEFDAVINKLGGSPAKNSVEENIMVGDAYRKSNRIVDAIPFYQAAIREGAQKATKNRSG